MLHISLLNLNLFFLFSSFPFFPFFPNARCTTQGKRQMWLLSSCTDPKEISLHKEKIPQAREPKPKRMRTRLQARLERNRKNQEEVDDEEEEVEMDVPLMRKKYLASSGFVDQANSAILDCWYPHRLLRWKVSLLFWQLRMITQNARVLFNWGKLHPLSTRDFLSNLAAELAPIDEVVVMEKENHEHVRGVRGKHGDCIVCAIQGKKSNTTHKCSCCDRFMHPKCFDTFEHGTLLLRRKR